jgi:hypothetical protein
MEYIIKASVTKISIKAGQILIQLDDESCHEE